MNPCTKKQLFFLLLFVFIAGIILIFTCPVFADDLAPPINNSGAKKINSLLKDTLFPALASVGTIVGILGAWKFAMGMSSDDAERLGKGVAELATAAVLVKLDDILSFSNPKGADISDIETIVKLVVVAIGIIIAIFGALSIGIGVSTGTPESIAKGIKWLSVGAVMVGCSKVYGWIKYSP